MSFFHTILNPRSMIYNPEDTTHRGRVIETNQRLYQIQEARRQATLKLENQTTNLKVGTPAIALAVMSGDGKRVESVNIVHPGKDYKYPPLISFQDDGHLATAVATITSGQVTSIAITSGGKGYVNPTISFSGADSSGDAVAEAVVIGGVINSITVTLGGEGYLTVPIVNITDNNVAVAEAVLNASGEITAINVTEEGRTYSLQPQITIATPSTQPTLAQRTALYDKYLKEFMVGMGIPFDIINAQFSRGQVRWAKITGSMSTITNPLWVPGGAGGPNHAGGRKIETVVPCPHEPQILVPDNPPECYFSIHNDGKQPIQEDRYTHNMRADRNDNASYLIKKANETVQRQVDNIVKNGGTGAIVFAIPHNSNGTIIGFNIQDGGKHFTTNPPTVVISRLESDPGKAQATVTLGLNGYINAFTVTNPTTNLGYTQSTPPDVYIGGIKAITSVTIGGGRVTGITINSNNNIVSYNTSPTIVINRIATDLGKAQATVTSVDVNGAITSFTIAPAGTGYDPSYRPRVSVTGGRGHVNAAQKQVLLDQALLGAFEHLEPNWKEVAPSIKSTDYKTDKSAGIIENNRSLHIVDVTDSLTRKQRQDYIHQESIIDKKARESALSRYNKAVALGLIPNVPAIPTAPELPKVVITTSTDGFGNPIGSGVQLEPYVDFEGRVTGFTIKNGGTGYSTSPPVLTFTPVGGDAGFGAAARPVVSSGTITDVEMMYSGYDYFTAPDVVISGGGGTGATFTAVINANTLKVSDVTVDVAGSNYLSLDLSDGGGSGFRGLLVTQNGVIIQIIIQNPGTGYNVQQPPNAHYLAYLAEAQHIVKRNEPPGPGETAPPTGKLPEPTLKDNALNMAIRKLNEQKRTVRRAKSTVITVAIDSRKEAKLTYEVWKAAPTADNKTKAQNAYNKAVKATAAAYGYQKWLPPASDASLKHKAEIFP